MLKVQNLQVSIAQSSKIILQNMSLQIPAGSIHAIMGPNGSGKSTFAHAIIGNPLYSVQADHVTFQDISLLDLPVHKRAQLGIFVSFQNPYVVPGLQVFRFLKETYTAFTGNHMQVDEFENKVKALLTTLHMHESFLTRNVNEGFSGGEKKRLEILQLLLFAPKLAILDEIDSGLDVDTLKTIAHALLHFKKENPLSSLVLITHYCRILEYIVPDDVHILKQGAILHSGNYMLARVIETQGYDAF